MTSSAFNKLDIEKQLNLVMCKGVLLTDCIKYNLELRLFQLENYYAEMFTLETNGELISIYAFEDMESLQPYLERIDISDLYDPSIKFNSHE